MAQATHRTLALAGAGLAAVALIGQGAITVPARMAEGGNVIQALVFYASFLGVVVVLGQIAVWLASARQRPLLRVLAGPSARAMMTAAGLVLIALHAPLLAAGMGGGLGDMALHYLIPALFIAWWAVGPHPVALRWARILPMLALPLGYGLWVLGRGVLIGRWPYPFTSVPDLGWLAVIANLLLLTLAFAVAALVVVALERVLHARARYGLLGR